MSSLFSSPKQAATNIKDESFDSVDHSGILQKVPVEKEAKGFGRSSANL
jgi:hypothetical protein